jgi:hypothetical protein
VSFSRGKTDGQAGLDERRCDVILREVAGGCDATESERGPVERGIP